MMISIASPAAVALSSLEPLEWENRIIVGFDPDSERDWIPQLKQADDQIVDRDIVWFVLQNNRWLSNYGQALAPALDTSLRRLLRDQDTREVLLLGKDGGVKNRASELDLKDIFSQIDRMPMRQWEMRNR